MTSKRKHVEENEEDLKKARPLHLRFEHRGKLLSVRFDTRYICLKGLTDIPPQLEQLPYAECIDIKGVVNEDFRMPVWALLKFKYIECNSLVPVQWDPRIYNRLTIQGREIVFTTLCVWQFGPLGILPVEVVHLILGHLPLYTEPRPHPAPVLGALDMGARGSAMCTTSNPYLKSGHDSCGVCMRMYICIDHETLDPVDDELCAYVTAVCGHLFHQCCIERWSKSLGVCPLCLAVLHPSV